MPMVTSWPIKEARSDMRNLYDQVVQGKEVVIFDAKTKNRETVSVVKTTLLEEWLSIYDFKPEIFFDKETNTWNVHVNELALYAYDESKEAAVEQAVDLVLDYVSDYLDRLPLFQNVPERRKHYPYIVRISHCQDRQEVKRLLLLNGNM